MNTVLIIVFAALGVIGRTLIPYLQAVRDNPDTKFDRKFILPAVVSIIISAITFPLVLSQLPESIWTATGVPGLVFIFAAAWGVTDITRSGQKQVSQ